MNRNRLILILLTSITLIQCKSTLDIDGLWVQTKLTTKNRQQLSMSGRQVFDFHKDSIKITSIGNLEIPDLKINKSLQGTYEVRHNKLIIKTGPARLKARLNLTIDSLTLIIRKNNNQKVTLKRLEEANKSDIKKDSFIGNLFLLSIGNYTDSIFFLNDTLMLYCGDKHFASPLKSWELTDYNGYKFFHTTNPFLPGMIVNEYSDSKIELKAYIKSNLAINLVQFTSKLSNRPIIGTWVETDRRSIQEFNDGLNDEPLKLIIEQHKLTIVKNTKTKTMYWRTTPDLSRIYFISEKGEYVDSWRIIDLSESILKLRIAERTAMEDYLVILKKE